MKSAVNDHPEEPAGARPGAPASAAIDGKALDAIRALQRPGKPDLLARIVTLFESETPKALEAMLGALDAGDIDTLRDAAHTLKSSSAYVGATALSARCRELERLAREGNLPACVGIADGLEDDYADAMAELSTLVVRAA